MACRETEKFVDVLLSQKDRLYDWRLWAIETFGVPLSPKQLWMRLLADTPVDIVAYLLQTGYTGDLTNAEFEYNSRFTSIRELEKAVMGASRMSKKSDVLTPLDMC